MMIDVALFGRLQSGPFFALLRKKRGPVRVTRGTARVSEGA
jgi:hypothetical protein